MGTAFLIICRDPATFLPDLPLSRFDKSTNKEHVSPPLLVNQRRGVPVWRLRSTTTRVCWTLPPPLKYVDAPEYDNIEGKPPL